MFFCTFRVDVCVLIEHFFHNYPLFMQNWNSRSLETTKKLLRNRKEETRTIESSPRNRYVFTGSRSIVIASSIDENQGFSSPTVPIEVFYWSIRNAGIRMMSVIDKRTKQLDPISADKCGRNIRKLADFVTCLPMANVVATKTCQDGEPISSRSCKLQAEGPRQRV